MLVLRYLPQEKTYKKAEYKALPSRRPNWETGCTVTNGMVSEGQLWLNDTLQFSDHQHKWLLLKGTDGGEWKKRPAGMLRLNHFLSLREKDGLPWLVLTDDYYPVFGSKARDRFDLAPLAPGKPLAVHINARYWHTMAGRGTDTHYAEAFYFLENLGQFETARFSSGFTSYCSLAEGKVVDLRVMWF